MNKLHYIQIALGLLSLIAYQYLSDDDNFSVLFVVTSAFNALVFLILILISSKDDSI